MTRVPVTVEFNDNNVVGFVDFTEEYKKIFEALLTTNHQPVLAPGYISDSPDINEKITKAELTELSVMPITRTYKRSD